MSATNCPVCDVTDQSLRDAIESNLAGEGGIPAAIITAGKKDVTLTKYALQKHRTEGHSPKVTVKAAAGDAVNSGPYLKDEAKVDVQPDGGGTIQTGEMFDDNADWDALLRNFGINPEKVIVKGDTIRMSARTVRYTDEFGNEQSKIARSFSAAFMPRPNNWIDDEYVGDLRNRLLNRGTKPVKPVKGANSTYLVCLADLQLGKSEGGGVAATIGRFNEAMDGVIANYETLVKQGYKFEQIALAQMGDMLEGCTGNYDSQLFTVELNQRRQLDLGIGIMTATIDRFLALGLPVVVINVNSNHGSWMRRDSKTNITSTSDTSDGAIEDALKRIFRNDPRVTFTDLHDQPVVTTKLSGVNMGFSHGHLTNPGKSDKWLDDMHRVLSVKQDFPVEVFVTAHSHHFMQRDLGAYQHFQCPALDGGSKWFEDMRGRWSSAGILTMVLGDWLPVKVAEVKTQWTTRPVDND